MDTFQKQYQRIKEGKGFIAALDQSGGSTPKALEAYGITESEYNSEEQMFSLIHGMRARVMTDAAFSGDKIIGVILFEKTMNAKVDGIPTPEYLRANNIVPFLKIDKGLEARSKGVQHMKDIPDLPKVLEDAKAKGIFGTKMRSVILENDIEGIVSIVKQQFVIGKVILAHGLVPILEPEVDIHSKDKDKIEKILLEAIMAELDLLPEGQTVILKLTIPSEENLYRPLIAHTKVLRVFALSGGYSLEEACGLLRKNEGLIASFSRALLDDLRASQSAKEFSDSLKHAIDKIYEASIT